MEHYSPLRYPGGKARLARFIAAVIRRNGHIRPEYVEPYAGGAGVALYLLFEEYADWVVINDADPRIYCFWSAVTEYTGDFIEMITSVSVSVDEWHRQREIYSRCDLRSPFELGFATFFLNRTGRSGIIHTGGPIGGYDQTGAYKIDARFNRTDLVRRIRRIGAYADRIEVVGEDGLGLLKELAADVGRAKRAVVYLDPPYYNKSHELYLNHFTHDQHKALATFLRDDATFTWMLTYDNASAIRHLYEERPQLTFSLKYSAYESREGLELLIHPQEVVITTEERGVFPPLAKTG